MGQTPHHRPAKTMFSTVQSNCDWQCTVELPSRWRGVPLFTVSRSCKEQLKIGRCWPVVWCLTFSGVVRMITCRRLDILCRVNTKEKWQIQWRISVSCQVRSSLADWLQPPECLDTPHLNCIKHYSAHCSVHCTVRCTVFCTVHCTVY